MGVRRPARWKSCPTAVGEMPPEKKSTNLKRGETLSSKKKAKTLYAVKKGAWTNEDETSRGKGVQNKTHQRALNSAQRGHRSAQLWVVPKPERVPGAKTNSRVPMWGGGGGGGPTTKKDLFSEKKRGWARYIIKGKDRSEYPAV